MNCEEVRQLLSPYLDSELDDRTTFVIGRHLDDCVECAQRFQQEQQLEEAIADRLRRRSGDERAVFCEAVRKAIAPRPPMVSRRAVLVGALGAASTAAFFVLLNSHPDTPDLVAAAADDHQEYVRGNMSPHVSGEDAVELVRFLRERVGVDVRMPAEDGAWAVSGARLCHLRSARVGLLMLRNDSVLVSLFVVPAGEAHKFPEARRAASKSPSCFPVAGGHGLLRVERDGTIRCAIGDLEPVDLEGLLQSTR